MNEEWYNDQLQEAHDADQVIGFNVKYGCTKRISSVERKLPYMVE